MEKHQVIALIAGSIYGKVPLSGVGGSLKEQMVVLAVEEAEKIYRMSEDPQNFKAKTTPKPILEIGVNSNKSWNKHRTYLWTEENSGILYFREGEPFLARDTPTYYGTAEEAIQAAKSNGYSVKAPKELAKS